jgi:hypothetical protein
MADATISRVLPTLNKKRGGAKHYNFVVEGTNFGANTVVEVIYVVGSDTYKWEIDNKELHGTTLLYVKLKRKAGGPDTAKDEKIRQIEQITVTVANPPQTPAELRDVPMGTFAAP